ncbi:CCA-adding enzyme [Frankliniella fusca]|uniref:CCA-adding enzyme n=1 Tax=Frankliniella fusca TaxID=407009 RepID=A0AAE1I4M4_9NEOP|nr:CCA-adding enzyme [Frankliniella fusca]
MRTCSAGLLHFGVVELRVVFASSDSRRFERLSPALALSSGFLTHETHRSPVRAPVIVLNAPARAEVVNMQEHQAKYACNTREQKTSKLPAPHWKNKGVLIFNAFVKALNPFESYLCISSAIVAPGEKKKRRKRRFTFKEEAATLRTNQRINMCGNIAETNSEPKRRD